MTDDTRETNAVDHALARLAAMRETFAAAGDSVPPQWRDEVVLAAEVERLRASVDVAERARDEAQYQLQLLRESGAAEDETAETVHCETVGTLSEFSRVELVKQERAAVRGPLRAEIGRLREALASCQKSNRELLQSTEESLTRLGLLEDREPLVQKLLEVCGAFDAKQPGTVYQDLAREDAMLVRDFDMGAKVENADPLHPTGRHPEGGCGCTDSADSLPCVFHSPNEAQELMGHLHDSLLTCRMQLSTARELRDQAEAKSEQLRGRWDRAETACEQAEAELQLRRAAQPAESKPVDDNNVTIEHVDDEDEVSFGLRFADALKAANYPWGADVETACYVLAAEVRRLREERDKLRALNKQNCLVGDSLRDGYLAELSRTRAERDDALKEVADLRGVELRKGQ